MKPPWYFWPDISGLNISGNDLRCNAEYQPYFIDSLLSTINLSSVFLFCVLSYKFVFAIAILILSLSRQLHNIWSLKIYKDWMVLERKASSEGL